MFLCNSSVYVLELDFFFRDWFFISNFTLHGYLATITIYFYNLYSLHSCLTTHNNLYVLTTHKNIYMVQYFLSSGENYIFSLCTSDIFLSYSDFSNETDIVFMI